MAELRLILGDQLQADSPLLRDVDPRRDCLLMIEAPDEGNHVWSHKARIALFLSAMRHFAAQLRERGLPLIYIALDDREYADEPTLVGRLRRVIERTRARSLRTVEPGEWRIETALRALPQVDLELLPDRHFQCSRAEFQRWAGSRRSLRMETFYRWMRRRTGVLIGPDAGPSGGRWNFDADNREPFPRQGPGQIPPPARVEPDRITREVFALVERHFAAHPGSLAQFAWPVTRAEALRALDTFIRLRLSGFGRYQDAMWTGCPFGWHAPLAASLNLKLLDPREVVGAAVDAWRQQRAPLASVEGFVRQVLGWREFIRGVYWWSMPGLRDANHYGHRRALPAWYWTGATSMACMRECIGQTLRYGYAHHIQRLMVTGQFALLAEIDPAQVASWYLAVYVDAVEWAELPNVAGMALHADGGRFTSKPYIASGRYIARMSNYCAGCRYRPQQRSGDTACPFTVLYWNFVLKHERALRANPRTTLMAQSAERIGPAERAAIRARAAAILDNADAL